MPRKRVDWEEELKKTERTRLRGFKITVLSLAFIGLFFMWSKFQSPRFSLPFYVIVILFGLLGIVLLFGLRKR